MPQIVEAETREWSLNIVDIGLTTSPLSWLHLAQQGTRLCASTANSGNPLLGRKMVERQNRYRPPTSAACSPGSYGNAIWELLLSDLVSANKAGAAGRGVHANRAGICCEGIVVREPPVDSDGLGIEEPREEREFLHVVGEAVAATDG